MPDVLAVNWTPADRWRDCLSPEASAEWYAVTDEVSDYFLSVLPPRYFNGGFACSEPVSFDSERGAETFQCFISAGRHKLTRVCTIAEAVKEGDLLRFAFGL